MRILFLGTPEFAVPSLEILRNDIIGVVTHPDRPKGRHLKVSPSPVKTAAEKYNIPVYQTERVSDLPESDLAVVVSFGEILARDVLMMPKLGCINLHASLLPRYRGAAPVAWALMNGEGVTGVTTFWLNEKLDAGDIILQKETAILPENNRGTLEKRLSHIGAELLKETIMNIDTSPRIPQDESKATYAPKIKKEDGLIDWSKPSIEIHNKIRAMNPWPGAYTYIDGIRVEIWESALDGTGIAVETGSGILLIRELQAEGKKRLKAVDFMHGCRISEGRVLRPVENRIILQ